MELTHLDIYSALKRLMEQKSQRDKTPFTSYQLAKALNIQHSIIHRLLHVDPDKRVCNPRIDTLAKIVDFFNQDGFAVSFDDLLRGIKSKVVDVNAQAILAAPIEKAVPMYTFSAAQRKKVGMVHVKLSADVNDLFALVSEEDIPPLFKKGSIFVVDKKLPVESDMLVAVRLSPYKQILIRKFGIKNQRPILKSCDGKEKAIALMPTMQYKLLGVVIQVNAKL